MNRRRKERHQPKLVKTAKAIGNSKQGFVMGSRNLTAHPGPWELVLLKKKDEGTWCIVLSKKCRTQGLQQLKNMLFCMPV